MTDPGAKVELMSVEGEIYRYYRAYHESNPDIRPDPDSGALGRLWSLFDALVQEVEG